MSFKNTGSIINSLNNGASYNEIAKNMSKLSDKQKFLAVTS